MINTPPKGQTGLVPDPDPRRHPTIMALARMSCLLAILLVFTSCAGRRPCTIVMLPDTQRYSQKHPALFHAQTEWVRTNRNRANIVFVTHVGDIVQDRSRVPAQWEVASNAMARLDGVVPWGVAIGNHDYDKVAIKESTATVWLEYFGPQRFAGRPWYGGASPNGLNSYQLFSGAGTDFLILHLEVNAPDDALEWARSVLRQHPRRAAIVSLHVYLRGRDGVGRNPKCDYRRPGNSGEQIWEKFICQEPQVFLVLCGHESRTDDYHQISTNAAGNPVLEMLADYQSRSNGGDGWLRLIQFQPAGRQIQVRTYSPVLDQFETDADSEFSVPWVMPAACWRRH